MPTWDTGKLSKVEWTRKQATSRNLELSENQGSLEYWFGLAWIWPLNPYGPTNSFGDDPL